MKSKYVVIKRSDFNWLKARIKDLYELWYSEFYTGVMTDGTMKVEKMKERARSIKPSNYDPS